MAAGAKGPWVWIWSVCSLGLALFELIGRPIPIKGLKRKGHYLILSIDWTILTQFLKNAFWASKGEETMKPRRGIVRFWPLFSFWLHLLHNWEIGKVELERALCQMAYWYPLWATSDGWYGSLKNRPTEWGCESCPDPVPLEKYRYSLCAKHIGPAHRAEPKRIHGPMSWPFRWSVGPEN